MLTRLTETMARLRAFVRRRDLDRDFEEELASHLAMLTEDNTRRGMSREQARRAALIRLGNPGSLEAQHRDARGLPAVEAVLQDLRFAFRLLARDPWFSAATIVTIALGIGINAIGFTVINAALFRGLPFEDPDQLQVISLQTRASRRSSPSYADLQAWRDRSRGFAGLAAFSPAAMNISDERALPEQRRGAWLTANAFAVLGQQPMLGRTFAPGDDRTGAEPVVIINAGIWKNRYGGDPNVLGRRLRLNGQPTTIVGVMPDSMKFPENTEVWAPLAPTDGRGSPRLNVFGRLRADTDRRAAEAGLSDIAQQRATADPGAREDLIGVRVESFTDRFVGGPGRTMFLAMMGAVSFVLLIACANVANLLLSRSVQRTREMALRIALGATRWRVVRQLLIESLLFGFLGGALGLVFAEAVVRVLDAAVTDPGRPYWIVFTIDYVVFGYVATICALTAILFGLAPALHVSKRNNNDVLKEGGRGSAGGRRARSLSGTMVVAELALTLVLLVGAGLMVRSVLEVYSVDIGISTDRLMTMRLALPESTYPTPDARRAFFDRLEPRLAAIPGVEAVAVTTGVPPFDGGERLVEIEGRAPGESSRFVSTVTISPSFFDAVATPLARGRTFRDSDGAPGQEAAIVNEQLAALFLQGVDPIGTRLRLTERDPVPGHDEAPWHTIVGISRSIRHGSLRDTGPNPVVYLPYRQAPPAEASLLVRTGLPPASVLIASAREVQTIDKDQPILTIQTLEQTLADARWPFRVFGGMFVLFGAVAFALSTVGLYGVIAYSVTQRTQEIGVRMALGATRRQVSWLILQRGLFHLAIGLPIGLAGAFALSRVLRRMLVEVAPTDPVTFATISILLAAVSIAACMLPAGRASRVDPVVALRAE